MSKWVEAKETLPGFLTAGKRYEVLEEATSNTKVQADDGETWWFNKSQFRPARPRVGDKVRLTWDEGTVIEGVLKFDKHLYWVVEPQFTTPKNRATIELLEPANTPTEPLIWIGEQLALRQQNGTYRTHSGKFRPEEIKNWRVANVD